LARIVNPCKHGEFDILALIKVARRVDLVNCTTTI